MRDINISPSTERVGGVFCLRETNGVYWQREISRVFCGMDYGIVIGFYLIILVYSIIVHEVSHGVVALWLGDKTAKYAGRLSLEPMRHIDWIGSVFLPLLMIMTTGFAFGWAKPVPYNPYNLRFKKWGPVLVALAGPATNYLIALAAAVGAMALSVPREVKNDIVTYVMAAQWQNLVQAVVGDPLAILYAVCVMAIFWNVLLATFNILPIPPLDGSKLLFTIFRIPENVQMFFERWGFVILVLVLLTPGLALPFHIAVRVLWTIFFAIAGGV